MEALLIRRWYAIFVCPSVATFDVQRPFASWRFVLWSVSAQALIEGAAVAWVDAGAGSSVGVSSLPIGPKLVLPNAPLWLGLVAFAGTYFEYFAFSGLLYVSARLLGGRGAFRTQAYLMALFWVPLMILSTLAQPFDVVGSVVGLAARLYALVLLGLMLASAQRFTLMRAWLALAAVSAFGLSLGLMTLAIAGPHIIPLLK